MRAATGYISQNNLILVAYGCPPNTSGIFLYGQGQTQVPFGNGWRCIAGSLHRLGLTVVDAFGDATENFDVNAPPALVHAGDTWNFQFWYRNPAGGGTGTNVSDGLQVMFCP